MSIFSKLFGGPNRSRQKAEKFAELDKHFSGALGEQEIEYRNNAKATWLVNRGIYYYRRGQETEALEDFDEAIQIKEDHIPAYLGRIELYFEKGDKHTAAGLFKQMPNEYKIAGQIIMTKEEVLSDFPSEFIKYVKSLD